MPDLPEAASQGFDNRRGPVVLATASEDGVPNAIYVSCVEKFSEDKIVVAENYFDKTRANILAGSKGALLFLTDQGRAFQIKGSLERHTEGAVYERMKEWLDPSLPGVAATVVNVEEVYSGAKRLL